MSSGPGALRLPPLVPLSSCGGSWEEYEEVLYEHFKNDFIRSQPTFPGKAWGMKRHPLRNGKEATFWHIITEGEIETERTPDHRRCERIRWPRPIIEAIQAGTVRTWYQTRRKRGTETRIALALPDFSYVVILAVRRDSVLLWTAFCPYGHRRKTFARQYQEFVDSGSPCP